MPRIVCLLNTGQKACIYIILFKVSNFTFGFNQTHHSFFAIPAQMTPLFLSLHLSVARVRTNYDQLPLTSLTDDAPRGVHVDERYYLPEEDTANEGTESSVDFDKRENPCIAEVKVEICNGSKHRTVKCRSSSLTSCHNSIPKYGNRKCEVTQKTYFPKCGRAFNTNCGCAS